MQFPCSIEESGFAANKHIYLQRCLAVNFAESHLELIVFTSIEIEIVEFIDISQFPGN